MRIHRLVPVFLGATVVLATTAFGCGGGDTQTASGTGTTMSTAASTGGGAGGEGSTGGAGGHGGGAGGGASAHGPPATDIVSAGEVSKSSSYKLVFTFGQSTQNQDKTTSPSYSLQGGLIGANGSPQ